MDEDTLTLGLLIFGGYLFYIYSSSGSIKPISNIETGLDLNPISPTLQNQIISGTLTAP